MSGRLPDWLVVGLPKAGTTTLAAWLAEHPQAYVAPGKELSFFDDRWDRGLDWYSSQFSGATDGQRAGEATPMYVYSDAALDRIRATVPDARIVLVLREPVARLWSMYWFARWLGGDPVPLHRRLARERRHPDRPQRGMPIGYLAASRYAGRVRALQERFPAEQLLVWFFDDLVSDPAGTWAAVCRHLGVDPGLAVPPVTDSVNPTRVPRSVWLQWALRHATSRAPRLADRTRRSGRAALAVQRWNMSGRPYPPMPPDLERELRAELAPDLAELERLLGRPLPPAWTPRT